MVKQCNECGMIVAVKDAGLWVTEIPYVEASWFNGLTHVEAHFCEYCRDDVADMLRQVRIRGGRVVEYAAANTTQEDF